MASHALQRWQGERAARLDELLDAHRRIGGSAPGRRTTTEQINWALVLRLAGEFQGFARDLQSEAAETFATWAAGASQPLESVLLIAYSWRLQLDRGNANTESLADAFERFGIQWWQQLTLRDSRTPRRQERLSALNRARNAIAHSNEAEIAQLRQQGYPMTLDTARRWRDALNGLAVTMDNVLAVHLAALFNRPRPW